MSYIPLPKNGAGEVKVNDADANTELDSISATLATSSASLTAINNELIAVNSELDTVNVNLGTIEADIEAGNVLLTTIDADTSSIATDAGTIVTNTGTTATNTGTIASDTTSIDGKATTIVTNTGTTATNTGTIAGDTTSIDGKTPALGQAVMASSVPVAIASDQSNVPVEWTGQLLGVGELIQDAWGVQKVSFPESLFSSKFTFDINPAHWFMFENGTQVYTSTNIVSTNGAGVVTADATKTTVRLESRECPRYQPNRGHLFSTAVRCPSKTADGIREWGLGVDGENGCFFRLKANGLLYAVVVSGGTEDEQVCDVSGVASFDVEKGNIYDIQFQWRGVGDYKFFINNVLVYHFQYLGTLSVLSMENPALPVHIHAEYTTASVGIYVGCVDVTSENGSRNDREVYNSAYAESVSVNGTDAPVLVVHNPLLIGSNTNTRTMTLARITVTCSKKATFKVWMSRNAGDITGEVLVALGNGSYVQTDSTDMAAGATRATAATTANMSFVTSIPVEAAAAREIENPYRDRIEFPIVRGDYLVVTCTASTASADCVVEWGEQR